MKSPLPLHAAWLSAHENSLKPALKQWKETSRVPPVLLLTGPRGIGKREIAYWIAQTLQCERAGFSKSEEQGLFGGLGMETAPSTSAGTDEIAPCRNCPSCERAESGNFLDFKEITPEKDSQTLKIDQFREMKESQGYAGFNGSYRIIFIPEAERMTVQAANSLLKILEEPPAGWIFLMTAADPSLLPSTVISRCQLFRMKPLSDETITTLLREQSVSDDRLEICVRLSQGSLTRALELSADEAWSRRSSIFRFLTVPHSMLSPLVDWAALTPRNFSLLLDQFEQIQLDLIRMTQEPGYPVANHDGLGDLKKHQEAVIRKLGSPSAAVQFWMGRSERIFKLRREMTAPLNVKLLVQDFLVPWLDAS